MRSDGLSPEEVLLFTLKLAEIDDLQRQLCLTGKTDRCLAG